MKDGCSCGTQSDCNELNGIYYDTSDKQIFVLPGWNIGCSVVEAILQSTLECFYGPVCLESLLFYAMNKIGMDSWKISRFRRGAFIQSIVNELFLEEWMINKSHSLFYHACAPIYCSYTIRKENDYIHTTTTILGLFGGLTILLKPVIQFS
ncbi:hypothetical protein I4U23_025418 [Adineta vaga]|nr:hypothetical protein I4U23_025418 [Adineta vaga]